ncbi:MAG: hypothetical protein WC843_03030 [Candidatus Gracilibacteria bacterium]|jgi:hypothetical protein
MIQTEKFSRAATEKSSQTGTTNFLKITGAHFLTPAEIEKLPNKELHQTAQRFGAQSRKAQKEFAAFLPEINKRKLFLEHKFQTICHYAAVVGGLSKKAVLKVLKVNEKLQDKPLLQALIAEQGWSKLGVISNVATVETQEFWKEKVESMSKSTLETFVQEMKKQDDLLKAEERDGADCSEERGNAPVAKVGKQFTIDFGNPEISASEREESAILGKSPGGLFMNQETGFLENDDGRAESQQRNNMSFKVTTDIEKQLRLFKFKLEKEKKQPVDWNEVMQEFLKIAVQAQEHVCAQKVAGQGASKHVCAEQKVPSAHTAEPSAKEGAGAIGGVRKISAQKKAKKQKPSLTKEEIQKSLPEKSTRHIPARVQRYIKQIYQEMCGFPDCKQPANIDHHTRRFKLVPNHDPEFIVSLCKNHERLAHLGLIKNEEFNPKFWGLRLTADENEPKFQVDQIVNGFRLAPTKS